MVILYHLKPALLPGGFVGVDVFFVLSGFFITRKLFDEVKTTGKLRILKFWAARAKRLLSNALLTLAFVVLVTAILLPAYRRPTIAMDVVSAASFWSNFHFAAAAVDYFRQSDPSSPVLHYWSLSIEEQFYFALPLVMFMLLPLLRRWPLFVLNCLLSIVIIGSLAAALIVTRENAPAAFFSPFARAWQLAIGGFLAINFGRLHGLVDKTRSLISWGGAAAIGYASVQFSDTLAYPGLYALVPTLGTVALVAGLDAGRSPRWLLTLPGFRWAGDRSYSLYLWHWPIIVFSMEAWHLGIIATALLILALASIAYRWVEKPIHEAKGFNWKATMPSAAVSIGAIVIMAMGLSVVPNTPVTAELAAKINRASEDFGANYADGCHLFYDQVEQPPCIFGSPGATKKVVLFGDSHAAQWFEPLRAAAEQAGWQLLAWTKTNCPSVDVMIWYSPRKVMYDECMRWRQRTIDAILALQPDLVILANLADYTGQVYDGSVLDRSASREAWRRGIFSTVNAFLDSGIRVAFIRDNPQMFRSYRACIEETGGSGCGRERNEAARAGKEEIKLLSGLPDIPILDFTDQICSADFCPAWRDGEVLYQDRTHLTATVTARLWRPFYDLLFHIDPPALD